jgi:hypothetical protein
VVESSLIFFVHNVKSLTCSWLYNFNSFKIRILFILCLSYKAHNLTAQKSCRVFGDVHNETTAVPYYSTLERMIMSERESCISKQTLANKLVN